MSASSTEWQEWLFEVVHDEASWGDSGITDWLNELENDEGLEIATLFVAHLGRIAPHKELVLVIAKIVRS